MQACMELHRGPVDFAGVPGAVQIVVQIKVMEPVAFTAAFTAEV